MRRSTEIPLKVTIRAPASPADPACAASGCSFNAVASAAGSVAVAIRSMSLQVSAIRRAEPATVTRSLAGCSRSASASSSATGSTFESSTRPGAPSSLRRSIAVITPASNFSPSPLTPRIRSATAASRSSVRLVTPSSSYSRRAVFAPTPGSRVTSTSDAGNSA